MLKEKIKAMNPFEYPTEIYPTCLLGYVHGPVRWETMDGEDAYIGRNQLFINQPPTSSVKEECCGMTHWVNTKYNALLALTHLQKKSRFGFLLMRPWCFHIWFFLQLQKQCPHGNWIPGSEFGKYFRFGLWRWDPKGTLDKITGKLKHWIGPWTAYINFSFHWD